MLKARFLFMHLCALMIIIGCAQESQQPKSIHHRLVPPLRLEPDTTVFPLMDLVPPSTNVDSVWSSSSIEAWIEEGKLFVIPQENHDWIGNIRLQAQDSVLDVPLYYSNKIKWEYKFPDPNRKYEDVSVYGDMNAWNPTATPLTYENDQWQTEMWLTPGEYGYRLMVDGESQLDPQNEQQIPNGMGDFNSRLYIEGVPRSKTPTIHFTTSKDSVFIHSNIPINKGLAFWNNFELNIEEADGQLFLLAPENADEVERSYLRIFAQNEFTRSNDLLIPLEYGKVVNNAEDIKRSDFHAMRLYFLMVDRFYNGTEENDLPTDDPEIQPIANFYGGDIQGVFQKMKEGYFDSLHLNSIWLSPIPKNPKTAYGLWDKGGIRSKFSAYHGYWPVSFTTIDERFGNKVALKQLIKLAHQKELNVLLDFVANHVHEKHPVYQAHKDEGWATNLYLPDGSLNTEKWDEHRLTTWFDTFLPTLNLEKQKIAEMLSDSAMYWLKEYNIDGFRHDATKHIPLNFWRTLTQKVRTYEQRNNKKVFQIGETYGSAALIASYLSYGMLDAQFDFNMYDGLVHALTSEEGNFTNVADQIRESLNYYGHHHLMGNMSGNQDKARFMSLATGEVKLSEDTKLAGWTRKINKQTEKGFAKLAMMHAFNHTLPGVPVVYYGDEIGMPGGNDPDNRRMMRFQSLSKEEKDLRHQISHLAELRSHSLPLQFGNTKILRADKDVLVILRTYNNQAVVILFNKGGLKSLRLEVPFKSFGAHNHSFDGSSEVDNGEIKFSIPAWSFSMVSLEEVSYE